MLVKSTPPPSPLFPQRRTLKYSMEISISLWQKKHKVTTVATTSQSRGVFYRIKTAKQRVIQNKKSNFRSSHPELFSRKGVLKICSKFTGEHSCRNAISIKLESNFIDIALRHGCSPVNLLLVFRTPFPRNTPGWLLLKFENHLMLCQRFARE